MALIQPHLPQSILRQTAFGWVFFQLKSYALFQVDIVHMKRSSLQIEIHTEINYKGLNNKNTIYFFLNLIQYNASITN